MMQTRQASLAAPVANLKTMPPERQVFNRFELVPEAGRMKGPLGSFEHLYALAQPICESRSHLLSGDAQIQAAVLQVIKNFARARREPTAEFAELLARAYFPRSWGEIARILPGSPALVRPVLSGNQGAGGAFGPTIVTGSGDIQIQQRTLGSPIVLPEPHALRALEQQGRSELIAALQTALQQDDFRGAMDSYTAIHSLTFPTGDLDQVAQRKGRECAMFIRPSLCAGEPYQIPRQVAHDIHEKAALSLALAAAKANAAQRFIASGESVSTALQLARGAPLTADQEMTSATTIPYFQVDTFLRRDGTFEIERIQLPDLVCFLAELRPQELESRELNIIQGCNRTARPYFAAALEGMFVSGEVIIVTRDEVISQNQDILEQHEVRVMTELLKSRGITSRVIGLTEVSSLPPGSRLLLMNVPAIPEHAGFQELLKRCALGDPPLACFPNPFIKYFVESDPGSSATPLAHWTSISGRSGLLSETIERLTGPEGLAHPDNMHRRVEAFLSFQHLLEGLGFSRSADIFQVVASGGASVPCFRYDPKSFTLAIRALADHPGPKFLREIRYKPADAIIYEQSLNRGALFAGIRLVFAAKSTLKR